MSEEKVEVVEKKEETKSYKYVVGVSFEKAFQTYYFGSDSDEYNLNDYVVVETVRGLELGKVKIATQNAKDVSLSTALKPIIRKATEEDIKKDKTNKEKIKDAERVFSESVTNLKLDMHLVGGEFTLDGNKVIFTYIADERVDFRELLKVLATKLHCRIELRQIGARDRAKIVGGLGPCGLPLCCNTFLSDFEGISINMAKNQLLALNIAKLSGQCGKLSCCLKYEDSLYTELKTGLPKLNQKVGYHNEEFKVTSINVLSKTIRLENKEETYVLSFADFFKETRK